MDAPAISTTPEFFQVTSALAMELASGLSEPAEVFTRHGLSDDAAKNLLKDPIFRKMVKEAQAEWSADQNTAERIRLKSQMALEELLLPTFRMAQDPRIPPASRTDAVKLFERLSGVSKSEMDSGGGGPKFILNINLDGKNPKEIEGEVIQQDG